MKIRIATARRAWECRTMNWHPEIGTVNGPRRVLDGGDVPADHTHQIAPGSRFVQFQMYGETQRMCEACARAAGVLQ